MQDGIYDQIVTEGLERLLRQISGAKSQIDEVDDVERPDYLARYLANQISVLLRALPKKDEGEETLDARQLSIANRLLRELTEGRRHDPPMDPIAPPARLLKAIYRTPEPPRFPTTPLSKSNLMMNAVGEPKLGFELEQEMRTADRVLMIVSFIQWRGWQRLKDAFEHLARNAKPVRILTTTYIGATDFRALVALARLPNVELRISLDGRRRRLHAKSWLFERDNGFSSVYVGSANLSGPAMEDGIEWTVKLSEVDARHVVERFRGAFESSWEDPEFEHFSADDEQMCARVREALHLASDPNKTRDERVGHFFDLRPHPYQQATLDQLEAERLDRKHFRNLVVAPTGTGKTLVAAFDYKRQIAADGIRPRLLFLAHREEILRQARSAFRHVLRDESFGGMLAGGESPKDYEHLFATIQSAHSQDLVSKLGADYWSLLD